jgi:hypothetical protein
MVPLKACRAKLHFDRKDSHLGANLGSQSVVLEGDLKLPTERHSLVVVHVPKMV